MTLFDEALMFAIQKHEGQKRLNGEDYINHPIRVHQYVCRTMESSICSVAILHDILEDTDTTYDDLLSKFGKVVAHSVSLLSKPKDLPYEIYIRVIKDSGDQYAKAVKIADLHDNLDSIDNVPDLDKRNRLKSRYEKALKELTEKK